MPPRLPPAQDRPDEARDPEWERRVACAEINGRRVNEAIERGRETDGAGAFVCECGRVGCTTKLSLTVEEYESVRAGFDRFLLVDGHELAGIDRVVERNAGYTVVAKQGDAAALAEQTDARRHDDDGD